MAAFIPFNGPVVANTAYVDNTLVARDVAITLPEVTPQSTDVQAMGTLSLPIWQLIENMEAAITKIGLDMGLRSMLRPEPLALETRWVQTVTDAGGSTKEVGCKAFMRGIPNKIPSMSDTVGETSENEVTMTLTRYQLFVDGQEMFLIDRLTGIVRIAGKDYAGALNNLL